MRVGKAVTFSQALKPFIPGGLCNHDRDGRPVFIVRLGNTDLRGDLTAHR